MQSFLGIFGDFEFGSQIYIVKAATLIFLSVSLDFFCIKSHCRPYIKKTSDV